MRDETKTVADFAVIRLEKLLSDIEADTEAVLAKNDLPTAVAHYASINDLWEHLKKRVNAIEKHVDMLSYNVLPTMFEHQGVKTISLPEVGRVTVNVRFTASWVEGGKEKALEWLRQTGNDGLIIETVASSTLKSFAKTETLAGRPLPEDLFRVGTARHISITKGE